MTRVERLLERGVLTENAAQSGADARAITSNKQPGRCCDQGCTQPGQAIMVPLSEVGGRTTGDHEPD